MKSLTRSRSLFLTLVLSIIIFNILITVCETKKTKKTGASEENEDNSDDQDKSSKIKARPSPKIRYKSQTTTEYFKVLNYNQKKVLINNDGPEIKKIFRKKVGSVKFSWRSLEAVGSITLIALFSFWLRLDEKAISVVKGMAPVWNAGKSAYNNIAFNLFGYHNTIPKMNQTLVIINSTPSSDINAILIPMIPIAILLVVIIIIMLKLWQYYREAELRNRLDYEANGITVATTSKKTNKKKDNKKNQKNIKNKIKNRKHRTKSPKRKKNKYGPTTGNQSDLSDEASVRKSIPGFNLNGLPKTTQFKVESSLEEANSSKSSNTALNRSNKSTGIVKTNPNPNERVESTKRNDVDKI